MAMLRLHPGASAPIAIDMNQLESAHVYVNDGPIESALDDPLGYVFETRTRFYGKVWTRGPYVAIRYYQARPLDMGPPIPICAVALLGHGGLKKRPGPAPGSAILDYASATVYIVDSFR